jgi:hypothetical protein
MKNNGLEHDVFLDRFTAIAEDRLAISRYEWGFKRAIKNALGIEKDSTVHRWFKKTFPSARYLIRISMVFDVSIAHLLGSQRKGGTLVQIQLIYGSGYFLLTLQLKISNDQLDVRLRRSFSFF